MESRHRHSRNFLPSRWVGGACSLLALGVYANTFQHGFAFDDLGLILHNPTIIDWRQIPALFAQGYWGHKVGGGGNYRPLTVTTFALEYGLWGSHPTGYHVVNVLLHACNTWLLFHLLRLYRASLGIAGIAALVFAVHPVHVEAVASIVGRAELLGFFCGSLMWWSWRRATCVHRLVSGWRLLAVAAYLGALLSKENFIVLPAALWLAEALRARRRLTSLRAWSRLTLPFGSLALALVPYFGLRALANEGVEQVSGVGNIPLDGYTLGQRVVTMASAGLEWYRLLLIGYPLKPWYDGFNVNIEPTWTWRTTIGLCLTLALILIGLAAWRRAPLVSFGLGLWFITLALVSNIPIPLGTLIAERWLYAPSVGYAIAVSYGAFFLWRRPANGYRALVVVWLGVMVGSYTYGTTRRNMDWKNHFTLFRRFIQTDPTHAIGYVNVASCLVETNVPLARALYEKALTLDERLLIPRLQLAEFDLDEGRLPEACARLRRLLNEEPPDLPLPSQDWALAHALSARALATTGQADAALQEALTAQRYAPAEPRVLITVGRTFTQLGHYAAATQAFQHLVTLFPDETDYRRYLGESLLAEQRPAEAIRELEAVLRARPNDDSARRLLDEARHRRVAP
ncbi:MAG: tetratricopeptide repeat protein [Chloracidobacterium sp.]|uniref:Tetratricopeptide repeat protein n=1 Tax=Chloracidobacterium validum TaxID=2821543 RepID=A0ABX8BAR6_9BACT|nr:tetratricopeptide repeat protein [Chloracidobacterium validum]QUW02759.1 tetratricopeptide repeat protein [Chloracidobacterium validum]